MERVDADLVPFAQNNPSGYRFAFGTDTATDDINVNYNDNIKKGWGTTPNEFPEVEDFNAMAYTSSYLIAYLYQDGIPEWNDKQKYYANGITKVNGVLYKSLAGTEEIPNVNNNPTLAGSVSWKSILSDYALINGDETKRFKVADAEEDDEAVNLKQLNEASMNINTLPDKPTPDYTDNFALQEVVGDLKKVSYKNLFDKVSITGSATFNGTTQTIDLTGIGNITLAIGDVIEVTGTTSNNKLFTVESIPSVNQIIVNYEHRGTSTPIPSKRLINETATATVTLYNRAKNAPLGQGQGWVKTPMSAAEIRQNLTGRTISWLCGTDTAATPSQISLNGTDWIDTAYTQGSSARYTMAVEVPNGYYFKITTDLNTASRALQLR